MSDEFILTYLQDVVDAIEALERFFVDYPKRFDVFDKDELRICAVERKTEIMGEAINRILKCEPDFPLPSARAIVNTRNRIIHAYDSVESEFLWGLGIRPIPALKADVRGLMDKLTATQHKNCEDRIEILSPFYDIY